MTPLLLIDGDLIMLEDFHMSVVYVGGVFTSTVSSEETDIKSRSLRLSITVVRRFNSLQDYIYSKGTL